MTLFAVCTGNICRSPAMERLLAELFRDEPDIEVTSGGTYAHDGEDMQPPMKQRVADYGAEVDGFAARQVTPSAVQSADLILTATRVHIEDMAAEVPEARDRMFTLPEFGRLLESLDRSTLDDAAGPGATAAARLAALVPELDRARRSTGSATREDDVVDPYMLPDSVYDTAFEQIREPIEAIARALRLSE